MSLLPSDPILKAVSDLAWFEGRWAGTYKGHQVEEHWSAPALGSAMGMFRWFGDGKVSFYELIVLEEEDGQVVMRIKHFYPGLKGWEEKDACIELDLVALEGTRATWLKRGDVEGKWLIYERSGDTLSAWFEQPDVEADARFRYELIK
jgi:hypothetical protein